MIEIVDGLRIYYETVGTGKPVFLLHGWGNDTDTLRPVFNELKTLGFKVYMIDFPGFGLSDFPPEPWGVSDYVNIVVNLINIFQLKKISVIGHSFGGRVGIKLSSAYPELVEKMILVDSAGIKPKRTSIYSLKVGWVKFIRLIIKILPRSFKINLESHISNMGSRDYKNSGQLRGTFLKIINEDLQKYLSSIKCSVLLVWGELDRETPISDGILMNKLIPNSSLRIIKNAGHHCFNDDLNRFIGLVNSFLNDQI